MIYGDFDNGHDKLSEYIGFKNQSQVNSTANSNSAFIKHKVMYN